MPERFLESLTKDKTGPGNTQISFPALRTGENVKVKDAPEFILGTDSPVTENYTARSEFRIWELIQH